MRHNRKQQAGLTLVELMVTLAVALVLLLIAAPMFSSFVASNTLTTASNLLASHMHLARSEAVKRGTPVTLCPSGDGATCAGTTQWSLGWLVFVDAGTPGQVDAGDTLLAISPNVEGDVSIQVSETYIRYRNDGTIDPT